MSFSPSGGGEYADDALPVDDPRVQRFLSRLQRATSADEMARELQRLASQLPEPLAASLRPPEPLTHTGTYLDHPDASALS